MIEEGRVYTNLQEPQSLNRKASEYREGEVGEEEQLATVWHQKFKQVNRRWRKELRAQT